MFTGFFDIKKYTYISLLGNFVTLHANDFSIFFFFYFTLQNKNTHQKNLVGCVFFPNSLCQILSSQIWSHYNLNVPMYNPDACVANIFYMFVGLCLENGWGWGGGIHCDLEISILHWALIKKRIKILKLANTVSRQARP